MSLIDITRVGNNLVALVIIAGIAFMIWSKMDKNETKRTIDAIKGLFGGKKE